MSEARYSLEDRIAYHDSICSTTLCDADISMYPDPPAGWTREMEDRKRSVSDSAT